MFEQSTSVLLVSLIAAHVIADFMLQTDDDEANKEPWSVLLGQAAVAAVLSYFLAGVWTAWMIPAGVFVLHVAVDAVKMRERVTTLRLFMLDQAAHLTALCVVAFYASVNIMDLHWFSVGGLLYVKFLVLVSGVVLTVYTGGHIVGFAVRPLLEELESATTETDKESRGFANGGQIIGRLERALLFFFVMLELPVLVGVLIAAKSIFRFGELREHKYRMEAEYILIGTLMSFGYGILLAYITKALLALV